MSAAALQRKNMVESQIRPSDITDRRITAAMQAIPREAFVPDALRSIAYMDEALWLEPDRAMLPPRILARLIQLAAVEVQETVLCVGALSGYTSAVLARLASRVVALESSEALRNLATQAFENLGVTNVAVAAGALADGAPADAPFDVIFVDGSIDEPSDALLRQVKDGGRLIAIVGVDGVGRAVVFFKTLGGLARRVAFDAAAPKLAEFDRKAAFTL